MRLEPVRETPVEDVGRQRLTPDPALCDAAGTTHAPASGEARIVSLVPSITELLFDLGAGNRVVGRTPFCIHPHDGVANVPRVGGTKTPRLDRIRALEPTHVILNVDENRREDADALAAFVPDVIVTHPLGPRGTTRPCTGSWAASSRAARPRSACVAPSSARSPRWNPPRAISRNGGSST